MKYFKNSTNGTVYAYEADGSQDEYILPGLRPMTAAEIEAHLNPPRQPVSEILEHAKNEIRDLREPMLSAVTGIGWEASEAGDAALVQEARHIRNALRDITDDPALNAAQTYEEMREAGISAYRRIAAAASPAFAATFKEITGA